MNKSKNIKIKLYNKSIIITISILFLPCILVILLAFGFIDYYDMCFNTSNLFLTLDDVERGSLLDFPNPTSNISYKERGSSDSCVIWLERYVSIK